jgi:hypothetical protein
MIGSPATGRRPASPTSSGPIAITASQNFDGWVEALGDLADEAAFAASRSAGQRAPDFTLPRLGDGAPVSLSGLWRSKPLVMEFGSFT